MRRVGETGIPDAEFEALRGQFSEKEIADLSVIVAMMNLWNRMAIGFRQQPPVRDEAATRR